MVTTADVPRPGKAGTDVVSSEAVDWWCRDFVKSRLTAASMLKSQYGDEKGTKLFVNELLGSIKFYRQRQTDPHLNNQDRANAKAIVPIAEALLDEFMAPPQPITVHTESSSKTATKPPVRVLQQTPIKGTFAQSVQQRRSQEHLDQGRRQAVANHPAVNTMNGLRQVANLKQRELLRLMQSAKKGPGGLHLANKIRKLAAELLRIEHKISARRHAVEKDLQVKDGSRHADTDRLLTVAQAANVEVQLRAEALAKKYGSAQKVSGAESDRDRNELLRSDANRQNLGGSDKQDPRFTQAVTGTLLAGLRDEIDKLERLRDQIKRDPHSVEDEQIRKAVQKAVNRLKYWQLLGHENDDDPVPARLSEDILKLNEMIDGPSQQQAK